MRRTLMRLVPLLMIATALVGGATTGSAQIWPDVRLIHGASDVGAVDVYVNGLRILNDMEFSGHTDYLSAPPGTQNVEVFADGGEEPLLTDQFVIEGQQRYTVAFHRDAASELAMSVWTDEVGRRPEDRSRLRVLHLAPNPEQISIARPDGPAPFDSVTHNEATGYTSVPSGPLTLRVRNPASDETLAETERTLPGESAASLALIPDPTDATLDALWLHDAGPWTTTD